MNFETSHNSPFKLAGAFLYYTGRRSNYGEEETIVTHHPVDGATILPGKPIDLTTARAVFATRGTGSQKSDGGANLLAWVHPRTIATHPAFYIWWSPAGKRTIFVAGKAHKAWFPSMVWCGSRTQPVLYLWAFSGENAPTPETIMYRPAYGPHDGMNHIFPNSQLCVGSARITDKTPTGWERTFFDSNFKTAGNLPSRPYEPSERYKKLGQLRDLLSRKTVPSSSAD